MEKRFSLDVRADGRRLEGYAALYGVQTSIGDFTEVIAPGAFADTLRKGRDILALADHDAAKLLARTKSGTLRLREDSKGLAFDLDLPPTTLGADMLALALRGDLGGMSFGFTIPSGGEKWDARNRTLTRLELHEISVVSAWPAYEGTTVTARMRLKPRLSLAHRYLETL